jgi:hypothetical protein
MIWNVSFQQSLLLLQPAHALGSTIIGMEPGIVKAPVGLFSAVLQELLVLAGLVEGLAAEFQVGFLVRHQQHLVLAFALLLLPRLEGLLNLFQSVLRLFLNLLPASGEDEGDFHGVIFSCC